MTPREHMGEALVAQRMSTFAQVDASRFLDKVAGMQAAREFGRAASHAFRALELLYDREQAALARAMCAEDTALLLANRVAWYEHWYPGQEQQNRQLHQAIAKRNARIKERETILAQRVP